MSIDKNEKFIVTLEIVGSIAIIGFWIGWFLDIFKSIPSSEELYPIYFAFESSFPLPDLWIVLLLLISAYSIFSNKPYKSQLAASAGGGLVFLGLIDISFNIQQNIYSYDVFNVVINIFSLSLGIILIYWAILGSKST
ncbi:hypothetical protein [Candidatus Hodarchaeum mangrovi]